MYISQLESLQRREFLRRTAALGLAGSAGPLALTLSGIGEAAAQSAPSNDYKALVCIFLYGGNDHDNTFVPYDATSHNTYKSMRNIGTDGSNIYIPKSALTALTPSGLPSGRQYGVQGAMGSLATLFNGQNKKMGILLNVGPLVKPTTKLDYKNAFPGDLPPKLFSHNDQFNLWQSCLAVDGAEGAKDGWGGRLGDLFLGSDKKSHFTCINAAGNAVFVSGQNVLPYQVTSGGSVAVDSVTYSSGVYRIPKCQEALRTLLSATPTHWMEKEWARTMKSSIDNRGTVDEGIKPSEGKSASFFNEPFNDDSLSAQLKIVARLIHARSNLDVKRQVFFVSLGGFDHHDGLLAGHAGADGNSGLLKKVNDAMYSFYKATEQLGVANQVTAFTASDFGRTMASNGDGSDHGWGSHHMVMGGEVDGGKFWGKAPDLSDLKSALDGPDTVGQGRLLPSTSVDEFAAALARWMGVSESDLATVLPNYSKFAGKQKLPIFASGL